MQSVGFRPLRQRFSDRIGQSRDVSDSLGNILDPRRSQREALSHGAFEAGILNVLPICGEDVVLASFDRISDGVQQRVLFVGREQGERRRRSSGANSFSCVDAVVTSVAFIT